MNLFTAGEGKKKQLFFGKSKVLDGFLEGISRTKAEQLSLLLQWAENFFETSSLEQSLRANLYRNLIIYCSGFLSKSDNVCRQKVAIYQDSVALFREVLRQT